MTFYANVCDITLNASSKLGDVYLVSQDKRYFVAHKMVLASVSTVLDAFLSTTCEFCAANVDEYPVLFLEGYKGETIKNFLSIVYTGKTHHHSRSTTT